MIFLLSDTFFSYYPDFALVALTARLSHTSQGSRDRCHRIQSVLLYQSIQPSYIVFIVILFCSVKAINCWLYILQ